MDMAVKDYNSMMSEFLLNYLTPDKFEEKIAIDREFKEKWLEKQIGRYENVLLLEWTQEVVQILGVHVI